MKRDLATEVEASQFGWHTQEMVQALGFGSFEEPLAEGLKLIESDVSDNFAAAGSPRGAWPPRKPRKGDDGHPLLILTGDLYQAATNDFGRGHVKDVGDREALTRIDHEEVPYDRVHQVGYPARNIPARPYFEAQNSTLDKIGELVADRGIELMR